MVNAVPVLFDHVCARILGIQTAEALTTPGVLREITSDDGPGAVGDDNQVCHHNVRRGDPKASEYVLERKFRTGWFEHA